MTIIPTCRQIEALAPGYDFIPICREVYADFVTPITLLRRIAEHSSLYYLLESVEGGESWGRYSFLGSDPLMRVTCKSGRVTVTELSRGEREGRVSEKVIETRKPYGILRDILSRCRAPRLPELPPFTGGFVGYFAYSMIGYAEPTLHIKNSNFNDFDLMLFDKVIAYDHLKQKISIIVNMKTDQVMENYGKACAEIETIARLISDTQPPQKEAAASRPSFACSVTKEEFCQMAQKAKKHIADGDIFQAVISRQFVSDYTGSLFNAYRVLRTTNPSPYMVYLHTHEEEIISTSPETLVRLQNGRLTTFPVAGSRPRGGDADEDARLVKELLSDEKELAEHNMLVDLGRNDLGKISEFSTVELTKYQVIHKYSKIMHICSQVEGHIRSGCDACSAIEAVLPAGTLSGAPKIRACQIIEELEAVPRGIYGGALGYIDFTGNLDTCIAIRMAVKKNHKVYVQAGSGIVADSVPETEYEESENKAGAVINAILQAGEVNDG